MRPPIPLKGHLDAACRHKAARAHFEELEITMFIAMNRFKVAKGSEAEFERVWLTRETYLHELPGFVEFHLLKGPVHEDYVLYSSHTLWQTYESFEGWTKSDQFRRSHAAAEARKPVYLGHPEFEGFHVLETLDKDGSRRVAAE